MGLIYSNCRENPPSFRRCIKRHKGRSCFNRSFRACGRGSHPRCKLMVGAGDVLQVRSSFSWFWGMGPTGGVAALPHPVFYKETPPCERRQKGAGCEASMGEGIVESNHEMGMWSVHFTCCCEGPRWHLPSEWPRLVCNPGLRCRSAILRRRRFEGTRFDP